METLELVKEILKPKVEPDKITLSATMKDIGIDSLDLVEVVLEVEEKLGVSFEDDELLSLKTIQNVVDLIDQKR